MNADILNFDNDEPTLYERLTTDHLHPKEDDHSAYAGMIRDLSLEPLIRNYQLWCANHGITPSTHRVEDDVRDYPIHAIYSFGEDSSVEFYTLFPIVDTRPPSNGYNTHAVMSDDGGLVEVHRTEYRPVRTKTLIISVPTREHREQFEAFINETAARIAYDYDDEYYEVVIALSDIFRAEMSGIATEIENVRNAHANEHAVLGFLPEDEAPGEAAAFTLSPNSDTDHCVQVPIACVSPSLDEWQFDGLLLFPCDVQTWRMVDLAA
ncbi:hypothetical protein [Microbacterium sp. p3-SID336]|uniref:hypothetical protein n=1 Tax=Microbacterium sp. p3-SID336 TaxID=2916212 RepID=UPI0021A5897D|nr:hypothetical protein [Microbacterium sp. p3-SID336]MCT1478310.1 hypothetical protein [Microbacterium sp. p3-SID336]